MNQDVLCLLFDEMYESMLRDSNNPIWVLKEPKISRELVGIHA